MTPAVNPAASTPAASAPGFESAATPELAAIVPPDAAAIAQPTGPVVTVHVVRHGLVHNPRGVLYGRLPGYRLSDVGRAMAERAAVFLRDRVGGQVGYLASSPLERARETAVPIARELGLDVIPDSRLIESENLFEGTTFAVGDGVLRRPSNWPKVRDPFTPSWGEPYLTIARRMLAATYAAVAAGPERHAVLVSHQLPIWMLRRYLEGKHLWHNPSKRQCGLASVTAFTFTGGVLTGIRYDEPAADLVPGHSKGATGA